MSHVAVDDAGTVTIRSVDTIHRFLVERDAIFVILRRELDAPTPVRGRVFHLQLPHVVSCSKVSSVTKMVKVSCIQK